MMVGSMAVGQAPEITRPQNLSRGSCSGELKLQQAAVILSQLSRVIFTLKLARPSCSIGMCTPENGDSVFSHVGALESAGCTKASIMSVILFHKVYDCIISHC